MHPAHPGGGAGAGGGAAAETPPPIRRILRTQLGWAPDERTLQRNFHRLGLICGAVAGSAPVFGRIFFEQSFRDNLDIGRPDHVALIFHRRILNGRKRKTPGPRPTRVITNGVIPSLHADYKNAKIKQYYKQGRALRTETTIIDPHDFGVTKRLTSLPDLRQLGFTANRRLLGVQTISHDPIRGAKAFTELTGPILTDSATRIAGLRFGDDRVHALLSALLVHRLLPHGFTDRELRTLTAPLLGKRFEDITAGQMTYDLRRLRVHGLIERIPRSRRYHVTDTGLQHALLFTHAHHHLLRTGLALTSDPSPPRKTKLHNAARAYQAAFDELTSRLGSPPDRSRDELRTDSTFTAAPLKLR